MSRIALDQVVEIIRGTPLDRKARADTGVLVFGLDDLSERETDLPPYIPEAALPRSTHRLRDRDLVIALVGEIGRVAFIGKEQEGAVLDRECAALRLYPGNNPVTPEWLHVWMHSRDFRIQIEPRQRGATMQRVRADDLLTLQLPLASKDYQLEAAHELNEYDEALCLAERQVEILREMRDNTVDLRVYAGMDA